MVEPNDWIELAPQVAEALETNRPVVALESSLIAHGLPRPHNLEVAREMEAAIWETGAVPATIAILDGQIRVGLSEKERERTTTPGLLSKVSRRDIPLVVASGGNGGTTVAATAWIARHVGIVVMATGGIGGVHRGAGESFDISADIPTLAQTDIMVICSGPKAILDIGLTLEQLETWGVPVLGYGTGEVPAFFARQSGFPVDLRVEGPGDVVAVARTKWGLGLAGAVLVGVPVPVGQGLNPQQMEQVIARSVRRARKAGIQGKALTPYLLDAVERATGGRSVTANKALLVNNARVAAEVARAWVEQGSA